MTYSYVHRLVHQSSAVAEPRRRQEGDCRLLATSASRYTQAHILAGKEIDGPLCHYRKGFFAHLKPRVLMMSVSNRHVLLCKAVFFLVRFF
jgi:hypothetical protein